MGEGGLRPGRRLLHGKAWPRPGHVLAVDAAAQCGAVASAAGQQGAPAAMVAPLWRRWGWRERARGWRGARKARACVSTSTAGRGEGSGRAEEEEGAHSGIDATHPRRVRPLRHFTEHVSSSKVA